MNAAAAGALFALLSIPLTGGGSPWGPGGPAPNDLVARGRSIAVVSAEPRASAIGLDVLRRGGNAVDATVAVALALSVTHPTAGNLGGGGFLLLRLADGRSAAIDFRERAPAAARRDMYLRPDGSVDEEKARLGVLSAGVPGTPAGLALALRAYGTMSLKEIAAPAIRLAREGIPVDLFLAEALERQRDLLGRFPSTRRVFFRGDEPLRQGDLLVQEDLARTLERFSANGEAGFYGGETARLLVAQMEAGKGLITEADLEAYAPVLREPLHGTYRGLDVWSMPPPSSGGVALLQMLNLLEPYDVKALGFGGSASIHLLTEVMRRAYADRSKWLGDPSFVRVPLEGLVSKDYAERLRKGIRLDRVSEVAPGTPPMAPEGDHTTHFSVVDKDGSAVACTTTINSSFGSKCLVDGAGFFLNNEMDDFSAKPRAPNQFGLIGGEANAIAPGKRMLSSMTPTIVTRDGEVRYVLGSPGGGRIITAVLQVLVNAIDHGMPLERAVQAPRIHHQWAPDELLVEPLALSPDVERALRSMGHRFAAKPREIGRVQAIEILPDGTRIAACDPRSGGAARAE